MFERVYPGIKPSWLGAKTRDGPMRTMREEYEDGRRRKAFCRWVYVQQYIRPNILNPLFRQMWFLNKSIYCRGLSGGEREKGRVVGEQSAV